MKKSLKVLTATLAFSLITCVSTFSINSAAYAENSEASSISTDVRPHFENGYAVLDGIKYYQTSATTVSVYHGEDYETPIINIPSKVSIDDVNYAVTAINDDAFKGTDGKTYAASKIIIPATIKSIGNYAIYSLTNVRSIDFTSIDTFKQYTLTMDSRAILDRIKLNVLYKTATRYDTIGGHKFNYPTVVFDTEVFKPIMMYRDKEMTDVSYWLVKDSVRVNELSDPKDIDGYTFSGYTSIKSNAVCAVSGNSALKAINLSNGVYCSGTKWSFPTSVLTKYVPTYEKGQPLWDAKDKINTALSTFAVDEDTTQTQILRLIESCLTFDNISYSVDDFRIIPSQDQVRGALRCTINLKNTNTDETSSIDVDIYTTELPTSEKIKNILDKYNNYTEKTSVEDLAYYLKTSLADNGLDINISNFNNNKEHVTGILTVTNKLDGLKKNVSFCKVIPGNIKKVIESAISSLKLNNLSTSDSVVRQIVNYVDDDEVFDISMIDFKNKDGKVSGTIVAKDSDGISTLVALDAYIPERSQTLAKAYEIVQKNYNTFVFTDGTTEDELISYISNGVNDAAIEISIDNFRNKNGAVKGTINLYDVDEKETKTIDINKNTLESLIVEDLSKIIVSKDTTSDDIYKKVISNIGDSNINIEIKDFVNENGHITAILVITKADGSVIEIPIDEMSVSQTIDQAAYIIEMNLSDYCPTASTTGSSAIEALTAGIKDADIHVTIPDFANDGTTVTGTIYVNKEGCDGTTITLKKAVIKIPAGNGGNTSGSTNESPSGNNGQGTGSANGFSASLSGGTSSNTNTNGDSSASIGNTAVTGGSVGNTTAEGGSANSSTGAISLNMNPNMGTTNVTNGDTNVPVNVTVNLNGSDILGAMLSGKDTSSSLDNDKILNLLLAQYMQNLKNNKYSDNNNLLFNMLNNYR